jgi:RecA/RadA recombinase
MAADQNYNSLTQKDKLRILSTVYNWASHLCFEEDANAFPYIVPRPEWKVLLRRLLHSTGNLIKVVGAQGSGKTTFAHWLVWSLQKAGQKAEFRRMIKGQEEFGYWDVSKEPEKIYIDEWTTKTVLVTRKEWSWFYEDVQTLVVDLWDVSKTNTKDIVKALDAVQDWWNDMCRERVKRTASGVIIDKGVPNIVIMLQKEALPLHFFLGKMSYFELKPWDPEELVAAYEGFLKEKFQQNLGTYPFTREALLEIAFLSRGIFRKFKEYVAACFDAVLSTDNGFNVDRIITLEDVKTAITTEKLTQDMELTLCELWPRNKDNRIYAVKVLRFLRENGPTPQKVLATEIFDGNLMLCSRVLNKLGDYGFLKMEKKGVEKIWSV